MVDVVCKGKRKEKLKYYNTALAVKVRSSRITRRDPESSWLKILIILERKYTEKIIIIKEKMNQT